uniref:Chaperone DnaJ C-terminal domain-containing protein n=1 Tax=Cucumis sativus TaxID=3659 RepID=A0A0A0LVB1_CUCSA
MTGDLYIMLHIGEKHGIWRDGIHLYSNISIDYTEAILGTTVKVETVEGLKDLQIPAGVQPGDRVRLSCMGIPDINKPSVRGDHLFIVNVQIPKRMSDSERTKIKELALLKASTKNDEVYTHGMPLGTFDKHTDENQGNHASSQAIKRHRSLWSSIKYFIRDLKTVLLEAFEVAFFIHRLANNGCNSNFSLLDGEKLLLDTSAQKIPLTLGGEGRSFQGFGSCKWKGFGKKQKPPKGFEDNHKYVKFQSAGARAMHKKLRARRQESRSYTMARPLFQQFHYKMLQGMVKNSRFSKLSEISFMPLKIESLVRKFK